jgi:hypothetical protein
LRGLASVSTFQTPWPPLRPSGKPRRHFGAHRLDRSVKGRVAAPAHRTGTMEDLLGARLEDHIGMGAHPDGAPRPRVAARQDWRGSALVNRVHPNEYTIERNELCAHAETANSDRPRAS